MTFYLYCFQCKERLIDQSDSWEELHDAYQIHYASGHTSMSLTDEKRDLDLSIDDYFKDLKK